MEKTLEEICTMMVEITNELKEMKNVQISIRDEVQSLSQRVEIARETVRNPPNRKITPESTPESVIDLLSDEETGEVSLVNQSETAEQDAYQSEPVDLDTNQSEIADFDTNQLETADLDTNQSETADLVVMKETTTADNEGPVRKDPASLYYVDEVE